MKIFRPKFVLCPVDFSDLSSLALQYAHRIATCFDARLMVLHAESFMPPPEFTSRQVDYLVGELQRSRAAVHDHLGKYVQERLGNVNATESVVIDGQVVPAILKVAKEKSAGLIVMGTHGRSGFSRVMLGSVTERVLREADIPVLTVRTRQSGTTSEVVPPKRILCPVNFSDIAMTALEHAVALAECFGGELSVLQVAESGRAQITGPVQKEQLCQWIPEKFRSNCRIQETVLQGEPAEEIVRTASDGGFDLIVLGAKHKRFLDTTVIGTTTVRVTRHAPCPVFTVIQK
jgi:nucleotide-binding universal stress UspA family protein